MICKFLVIFCTVSLLFRFNDAESATKGRIESCPGCSLNRLKEVKQFIYEDVPKYANIEFKKIQGAPPELVILIDSDEEEERIPLKDLTRLECNELLVTKGFKLKLAVRSEL